MAKLLIDGEVGRPKGMAQCCRFSVMIGDKLIYLSAKSFIYLARLAAARCGRIRADKAGWIWREDLEPGVNQSRYLWRLSMELRQQGSNFGRLIQNNRRGSYRLAVEPTEIEFNDIHLAKFPSHEVRSLVAEDAQ